MASFGLTKYFSGQFIAQFQIQFMKIIAANLETNLTARTISEVEPNVLRFMDYGALSPNPGCSLDVAIVPHWIYVMSWANYVHPLIVS